MTHSRFHADAALVAIVLFHFVLCAAHGLAHARAGVDLSPPAALFVLTVIVVGPVAGAVLRRTAPRGGAWIVALTLAASFAFGLVNHFVFESADHVRHVAGPWRTIFGVSAALLAATESSGSALAVWCAIRSTPRPAGSGQAAVR